MRNYSRRYLRKIKSHNTSALHFPVNWIIADMINVRKSLTEWNWNVFFSLQLNMWHAACFSEYHNESRSQHNILQIYPFNEIEIELWNESILLLINTYNSL